MQDVMRSIGFFLLVVGGITALAVLFYAVG
jgi:hypothetical protein